MAQEGCIACRGEIDTRVCLTCIFTWGASGLIRLSTCTIHKAVIHNLSKDDGKGGKKKEFLSEFFQSSFRVPSEFHTPVLRHRQKSRCNKDDKNTLKQTLSWISYWVLFFLVLNHNSKCKRSRNTKKNLQSIHPSTKPIVPLHISKQAHTQCVSKDRPKAQKQKSLPLCHQLGTKSLDSTKLHTYKRNEKKKNVHPSIDARRRKHKSKSEVGTLFAATDWNLTKSQNSKVEINKSSLLPFLLPSLPQTGSSPSSPKFHHHPTPPSRSYSSLHLALALLPQPVSSTTTTSRTTTTTTTTTNSLFVCLSTTPKAAEWVNFLLIFFFCCCCCYCKG